MMIFCTLFDSNYLDKGLLMYRSLVQTGCDFKIYTLAMDDKCKEILDTYNYSNQIVISIDKFSDEMGLSEIRKNRPRGEFCWTCTSFLIDYVLTKCNEEICTYVDSDLYFYSDPQCLIDEMADKTVQIVPHRYNPTVQGKLMRLGSGTYCVQFNTFKNTPDALELLHWWKNKCLESCSVMNVNKNGVFGDQGYLEDWGEKANVEVLQNLGGGIAPWNIAQYELVSTTPKIMLREKRHGKIFELIFYHYHNVSYIEKNQVSMNLCEVWDADMKLVGFLYNDYLLKAQAVKEELQERFGIYPFLKSHPGLIVKKQKRNIFQKIIDRTFFLKLYQVMINRRKNEKYAKLNIINF